MNKKELRAAVKSLMSPYRFAHTLRVTRLAVSIANAIAPELSDKAYIAAMCHDVAKEYDDAKINNLFKVYDKQRYPTVHTLHGEASAIHAKTNFNIHDQQILNAIANHVRPPKNPDILSMIIYCADKLEPARTKSDVSNRLYYVRLSKQDIKRCFNELHTEICNRYN
jgi:predicted HD superfamily hydrolase involved in NAD metabolism